jgi:hypothetical protein
MTTDLARREPCRRDVDGVDDPGNGGTVSAKRMVRVGVVGTIATLLSVGALAATSGVAGASAITCIGTLASGTYQGVTVPSGQACAVGSGVVVVANVSVASGGRLTDTGATVGRDVHAVGAAAVSIDGGSVHKNVVVTGTSGAVTLTGATVGNNVLIANGAGAVLVSGNTVTNNMSVTDNAPGGATITTNAVAGQCTQNANNPFVGSGNTGPHVSACNGSIAPPGLKPCTGVLPSGIYHNVTVPSGQSCTTGSGVLVLNNVTLASGAALDDTGAAVVNDVVATGASSVSITGGAVNHVVHLAGTSGTVTVSHAIIGDSLVVTSGAGAVTVSDNSVASNVNVNNNSPGGATVTGNAISGKCSQSMNNPYTGSGNTGPNVSACNTGSSSSGVTTCVGTLASGIYQGLSVPSGQACTIGSGVVVVTSVSAASGGRLTDTGATVGRDVHAVGAAAVSIDGGSVHKNVSAKGTSGPVSVTGATVGNNVEISNGAGSVLVSGNTVANNVSVTDNVPGGATITTNAVAGQCTQSANSPYVGFGNTGPRVSSCNGSVIPPGLTTCSGTLSSGTYDNVAVPSGGSCTMGVGVIVLKNVTLPSGAALDDTGAAVVNDVIATGASSVSITGGQVDHVVHLAGTSGTVTVSDTTVGANLVVTSGAGAVLVAGDKVAGTIAVNDNSPGGATLTANTDGACHQHDNHPYSGSGNSVAGSCNGSNT